MFKSFSSLSTQLVTKRLCAHHLRPNQLLPLQLSEPEFERRPPPTTHIPRVATGKSLDSPEKGNVDKMSKKCPENVEKLSAGAENTIFGHFLDNFCLFGRCFCLVTLSNVRLLEPKGPSRTKISAESTFTLGICKRGRRNGVSLICSDLF